jgi:hypothetical protein
VDPCGTIRPVTARRAVIAGLVVTVLIGAFFTIDYLRRSSQRTRLRFSTVASVDGNDLCANSIPEGQPPLCMPLGRVRGVGEGESPRVGECVVFETPENDPTYVWWMSWRAEPGGCRPQL